MNQQMPPNSRNSHVLRAKKSFLALLVAGILFAVFLGLLKVFTGSAMSGAHIDKSVWAVIGAIFMLATGVFRYVATGLAITPKSELFRPRHASGAFEMPKSVPHAEDDGATPTDHHAIVTYLKRRKDKYKNAYTEHRSALERVRQLRAEDKETIEELNAVNAELTAQARLYRRRSAAIFVAFVAHVFISLSSFFLQGFAYYLVPGGITDEAVKQQWVVLLAASISTTALTLLGAPVVCWLFSSDLRGRNGILFATLAVGLGASLVAGLAYVFQTPIETFQLLWLKGHPSLPIIPGVYETHSLNWMVVHRVAVLPVVATLGVVIFWVFPQSIIAHNGNR